MKRSDVQTPISKPLIPTKMNTENGPRSSKCNEDHSNDKRDEIPKGISITHKYIKNEKLVYMSFDIEVRENYVGLSRYAVFEFLEK